MKTGPAKNGLFSQTSRPSMVGRVTPCTPQPATPVPTIMSARLATAAPLPSFDVRSSEFDVRCSRRSLDPLVASQQKMFLDPKPWKTPLASALFITCSKVIPLNHSKSHHKKSNRNPSFFLAGIQFFKTNHSARCLVIV
jgi:hypothetical protein